MKKSWLLLFLLIIVISTTGCSTTSRSITPNSISPKNNEIAHAQFCVGNPDISESPVTWESPLVHVQRTRPFHILEMPIEPGRYKITVTTSKPESAVRLEISYQEFIQKDKFGNPLYEFRKRQIGTSNRFADLNTEILIPDGSIEGKISIFDDYNYSKGDNCGTIIVTR